MSGGIDSSLSALLLQKQGYEVEGVTLKLVEGSRCCDIEDVQHAKEVCRVLGIKHHIVDVTKEFKKEVIDYFIEELSEGRTPNPCVKCNKFLKFEELFKFADEIGTEFVATGHYARIRKKRGRDGGFELLKGQDKTKDQTYYLSLLPQKWLGRILFPVGDYSKNKIRKIATQEGLDFLVEKKESQDLCFVSDKFKQDFIAQRIEMKAGNFVDTDGKVLGKHNGVHFYTIGQRKRIDLPNGPYFVAGIDAKKQEVMVTKDVDDSELFSNNICLKNVNFISGEKLEVGESIKVKASLRYQQKLAPAILRTLNKDDNDNCSDNKSGIAGRFILEFSKPQRAVTKGQVAVFYKGKVCLGGGFIN